MKRVGADEGRWIKGAYVLPQWELRVTRRCLAEDLNADASADIEDLKGLDIVRAFLRERSGKATGGRQVSPLTSGREVWVVAHGNDHRAGTWHDRDHDVVWLVAYRRHHSGSEDDFFPYCKEVDATGDLLPTADDYARLFAERDERAIDVALIEVPLALATLRSGARDAVSVVLDGVDTEIEIEIDRSLPAEALTVAFDAMRVPFGDVAVLLALVHPTKGWFLADRLPSRLLRPEEVAWSCTVEIE